jgi:hypothetical protein
LCLNNSIRLTLILCLLTGFHAVYAQDSTFTAHSDTLDYQLWPDLVRSAIVPGLGQIHQEKPGKAVIFYGLSLSFLYSSIHNWTKWNDTGDDKYLGPARTNLAFFLQIYAINILDVIDTYVNNKYQPWQGGLHSDLPLKSPWGAVARSAMVPGWGQVYNESYIKGVVSLGIFSTFAYNVINYSVKYTDTGESYYKDRRSVHSWYLGLTYVLIMLDAYVDANLFKFDQAMELTYNFIPGKESMVPVLGVRIEF